MLVTSSPSMTILLGLVLLSVTVKEASFSNGVAAGEMAARRPPVNNPVARNTAAAAGETRFIIGSPDLVRGDRYEFIHIK